MSADAPPDDPIDTVGGILWQGGAILLGLRSSHRLFCPLRWDVIGGHIERGETPRLALERELREEIGIGAAEPTWLRDIGYDDIRGHRRQLRLFLVDGWMGEPRIVNDEHIELRWFAPVEAGQLSAIALEDYRSIFVDLERDLPSRYVYTKRAVPKDRPH